MIDAQKLKKRDLYLNKIIAFQDTEPVKVLTGIRRCGKSSLLKLMAAHLKDTGVTDGQMIEMNFESYEFRTMTADDFYGYVKERIIPEKRMYLFFDEVQRVPDWEDAVNSFRVDFDCDIYITGSNAYLRFGGMPGIADVGLDQEKAMVLLDGIYSTVVVRDILEREKRRGRALENVVYFELLRRGRMRLMTGSSR